MAIFGVQSPERKPVVVDGDTYYKSEWLTSGNDHEFSPTVFLVEQAPHVSLRTHFHRNNQFQLFVRGDGMIGRHRLAALMVHYAGAYSGYGPIVAGADGLAYFTLRSVHEIGSLTPSKDATQLKRGPKRQLHSDIVPVIDAALLAQCVSSQVVDLIPLQPDGIAARLVTLPPRASVQTTDPSGSAGQFHVVVAGSMVAGGMQWGVWQSIFTGNDEMLDIIAGDQGLQVVSLQIPPRDPVYA